MRYRAAVIGCGRIGSDFGATVAAPGVYSHAGAYTACAATELVAVCDVDAARAQACGKRWHAAAFDDVAAMLREARPHLVSVCTPDETHFEVLRTVLCAPGVNGVLAEKPLALTTRDAACLQELAAARQVKVAINYIRRYSPTHVQVRDAIARGAIGSIQTVGGLYTKGTRHNGSHWFDLARFIAGDVIEVWGIDVRRESTPDPTLDAMLRFASGAGGHLQACSASAYSVFEMDIVGTAGRVRLTESGHRVQFQRVVDSAHYGGYLTLAVDRDVEGDMRDLTLRAVEDLTDAVAAGRTPRCTAADGVAALAIAEAVHESARVGRCVPVLDIAK